MNDQLTELAENLQDRAMTYSFLARAFSDEDVPVEFLSALAADVPQTGTELDTFAASLVGLDADALEQVRKDVAAEHSKVLLGMSAFPVSPFESVYTSEEHIMMQDSRDEVLAAYRANGFGKSADFHVPEDHICLELDFMAGLGFRACDALTPVLLGALSDEDATAAIAEAEKAMNAQLDFLEKHLLVWTPEFCRELDEVCKNGFYRGIGQMLKVFMDQEKEYVDSLNAAAEAE